MGIRMIHQRVLSRGREAAKVEGVNDRMSVASLRRLADDYLVLSFVYCLCLYELTTGLLTLDASQDISGSCWHYS
jgi:hypothetical protein